MSAAGCESAGWLSAAGEPAEASASGKSHLSRIAFLVDFDIGHLLERDPDQPILRVLEPEDALSGAVSLLHDGLDRVGRLSLELDHAIGLGDTDFDKQEISSVAGEPSGNRRPPSLSDPFLPIRRRRMLGP
jgi:hypothetical protein